MKLGITKTIDLGDGREISVETGKLAKQADGAVVVRQGDTMILATIVSSTDAREGVDFLPLTVDYREKYAAAGRFPGGYLKREARPTDGEVLNMRIVDRALRPLFPSDYHAGTQVMLQLMSYDELNQPDALLGFAASACIAVSDIPFAGPMSIVRVSRVNGELVINPTLEQMAEADYEMMIAGTENDILMLEGEMKEISEADMVEAIKFAQVAIKKQCIFQNELASEVEGTTPKREYNHETHDEDLEKAVHAFAIDKCKDVARQGLASKEKRAELFGAIKDEVKAQYSDEEITEKSDLISVYFKKTMKEAVRRVMLDDGIRLDGRKMDEIRPIWSEVDYLPRAHGSALFQRGETQALMTLTLGGKMNEQLIDAATAKTTEKFLLHYNFPPFSTGEERPIRGISRREIGHGNLALRALKGMLPDPEDNPYTIRLVSEILESNGSSSMATVCAGTLALLDGGIKLKKPVSGIAMGLIQDEEGKYVVLSDILGDEDHLGDMDFKVTGTRDGITACQMDIKVDGLSFDVLTQALEQAKAGRMHILDKIEETMSEPRAEMKPHAPRIVGFDVPEDSIGAIIGPGGKIIQEIQKETGTVVTIEEVEVDGKVMGRVQIVSTEAAGGEAAEKRVRSIAYPPIVEDGAEYEGPIKSVQKYGVFVEILPGSDGLIHISEFNWEKIQNMEDFAKEGDMLKFKVVGKDPKTRKWKLSRKVLLPKPETKED